MEDKYRESLKREEEEHDRKLVENFVKMAEEGHSEFSLVRIKPCDGKGFHRFKVEEMWIRYSDKRWIDEYEDGDDIITSQDVYEGYISLEWHTFWAFQKGKEMVDSTSPLRGEDFAILNIKIEYLISSLSDKLERVNHRKMIGSLEWKTFQSYHDVKCRLEGMLQLFKRLIFNENFYRLEILPIEYALIQKECPILK